MSLTVKDTPGTREENREAVNELIRAVKTTCSWLDNEPSTEDLRGMDIRAMLWHALNELGESLD